MLICTKERTGQKSLSFFAPRKEADSDSRCHPKRAVALRKRPGGPAAKIVPSFPYPYPYLPPLGPRTLQSLDRPHLRLRAPLLLQLLLVQAQQQKQVLLCAICPPQREVSACLCP